MNVSYGKFGFKETYGLGVTNDGMLLMEISEKTEQNLALYVHNTEFEEKLVFFPSDHHGIHDWFCAVSNWLREKGVGANWSVDCFFDETIYHYRLTFYFESVTDPVMLKLTIPDHTVFQEPEAVQFETCGWDGPDLIYDTED